MEVKIHVSIADPDMSRQASAVKLEEVSFRKPLLLKKSVRRSLVDVPRQDRGQGLVQGDDRVLELSQRIQFQGKRGIGHQGFPVDPTAVQRSSRRGSGPRPVWTARCRRPYALAREAG